MSLLPFHKGLPLDGYAQAVTPDDASSPYKLLGCLIFAVVSFPLGYKHGWCIRHQEWKFSP